MPDAAALLAAYTRALVATLGLGDGFAPALALKLDDDARNLHADDKPLALTLSWAAILLGLPDRPSGARKMRLTN